jgi:hypothetical protein
MSARKNFRLLIGTLALLGAASPLMLIAQTKVATQHLTMEVRAITRLVVSDDPKPMIISRTANDAGLQSASDRHTRYSLLTNLENMKISASIDREMPHGTSLRINLNSAHGVSRGDVDLSRAMAPREVVAGIHRGFDQDQSITYTFSAERGVRELKSEARMITLTLTD